MFTGLIEELGSVVAMKPSAAAAPARLQVSAPRIAPGVRIGDSIAVNGCCLTVTECADGVLAFDLLEETLKRTNLGAAHRGGRVNLERALAADGRLGGHFVQGHVDCTARVLSFDESGADHRLEVELPRDFAHYVAFKGSIAINGISLTVAEALAESFVVWIIPHTKRHTNLEEIRSGDLVNVEFDLLAKYLERMLGRTTAR